MGGKEWWSENTEDSSRTITRRSVLASAASGAMIGVAGCTGGGGGGGGGQGTTIPPKVESAMPTTAGSQSDTLIPGEIVHQGLEGVEVLDHWAERDPAAWIKVEIQNNRDEPFKKPGTGYQGEEGVNIVRSRVLTEQGNQLSSDIWVRGNQPGPGKIKPGTSAIIGLGAPGQDTAARYELCLHPKREKFGVAGFKKACTDWTPTASPTPTPGSGPGSNEVIHNGVDNIEVLNYELVETDREGFDALEVTVENTGDESIKRFYVGVQFWDEYDRLYPQNGPKFGWAHPASFTSYDGNLEAGDTMTLQFSVKKGKAGSYEICVNSTNNKVTKEKVMKECGWERDG